MRKKWNKQWIPPPKPDNIFDGVTNGKEIAEIIRRVENKCLIIVGSSDWKTVSTDWKQAALTQIEEDRLVIVYVRSYCNQLIHGIRRMAPLLYLTNRLDWLQQIINSNKNVECLYTKELSITS
jgi:hypothetical protein